MLKEVCVENFTAIPKAIQMGAGRIELCDHLAVGGTTVSHGVAKKAIDFCKKRNVKVMTIIRPRGGDFVYSQDELEIMIEDIRHMRQLGTDGIVVGCLNEDGLIDEQAMEQCLAAADGLDVTFHMAFDHIPSGLQLEAIDWLVAHGVQRILTHGGPLHIKIEENLVALQTFLQYAAGRIIIMPGGGITTQNLSFIVEHLEVQEIHGTKIVGEL